MHTSVFKTMLQKDPFSRHEEVKPAKGCETSQLQTPKHTEEKIPHFTFLPNADLHLNTALKLPRATAAPALRSLMASPTLLK